MPTPQEPIAVEIRNLSKTFFPKAGLLDQFRFPPPPIKALDQISLTLRRSEIFALMGPNGAGKTTLIKILCSLILPDAGEFRIHGAISLVLGEERSFYPRLTGRQNLEFFAALYGLNARDARLRIGQASKWVGLERLDQRFQEYSTGMKHRLSLMRSFLNDASVIFMDEPTRSMDPNSAAEFREQIRGLCRKYDRTILITTHQSAEAQAVSDRIAIMDSGRIKISGTLEELRKAVRIPLASLEEIFHTVTLKETAYVSG